MPLNIIRQDILKTHCDVIVNATNRHMTCDFGVSKAILEAAGDELSEYLQGSIEIGEVRVTPALKLQCKRIFHVAGPLWRGGNYLERELLALCYKNVLKKAVELGAASIAIPLISSGARGFPKEDVLHIAVETIADFLMDNEIDVYLVIYDKDSYSIGKELYGDITEYINDNYVDEDIIRHHGFIGRPQYYMRRPDFEEWRPLEEASRKPSDEVLLPNVDDEEQNAQPAPHEEDRSASSKDKKPILRKEDAPTEDAAPSKKERLATPDDKHDDSKEPQIDEKKHSDDDSYGKRRSEKYEDGDDDSILGESRVMSWEAPAFLGASAPVAPMCASADKPPRRGASNIHYILEHADDSFAVTLLKLIDAKGISDVECYKKANVSRQTWHKIISDEDYKPSKTTVIAFAIALKLSLDETKHLLETVGFALSKSLKFDLIIEYFISRGEYDIFKINDALFEFDQVLLGV